MTRYEVTMEDGWKTRLNAESTETAKAKAESMNRFGHKAVAVAECEDLSLSEWNAAATEERSAMLRSGALVRRKEQAELESQAFPYRG